jgi:hypothetical protein
VVFFCPPSSIEAVPELRNSLSSVRSASRVANLRIARLGSKTTVTPIRLARPSCGLARKSRTATQKSAKRVTGNNLSLSGQQSHRGCCLIRSGTSQRKTKVKEIVSSIALCASILLSSEANALIVWPESHPDHPWGVRPVWNKIPDLEFSCQDSRHNNIDLVISHKDDSIHINGTKSIPIRTSDPRFVPQSNQYGNSDVAIEISIINGPGYQFVATAGQPIFINLSPKDVYNCVSE